MRYKHTVLQGFLQHNINYAFKSRIIKTRTPICLSTKQYHQCSQKKCISFISRVAITKSFRLREKSSIDALNINKWDYMVINVSSPPPTLCYVHSLYSVLWQDIEQHPAKLFVHRRPVLANGSMRS